MAVGVVVAECFIDNSTGGAVTCTETDARQGGNSIASKGLETTIGLSSEVGVWDRRC